MLFKALLISERNKIHYMMPYLVTMKNIMGLYGQKSNSSSPCLCFAVTVLYALIVIIFILIILILLGILMPGMAGGMHFFTLFSVISLSLCVCVHVCCLFGRYFINSPVVCLCHGFMSVVDRAP